MEDPVNRVGLFEPLGTRQPFRRQGLATALMRVFSSLSLLERPGGHSFVPGYMPGPARAV